MLPTKRMFDMVLIMGVSLHLAWRGLVRPWGQHWLTGSHGRVGQTIGEIAVRGS